MGWIRLSDDYTDHPKFAALSDGAFRLWHQAMGFCRKYRTDGIVPTTSLRQLKAYSPKRMRELMTPWTPGANPLWHDIPSVGIRVHDFLDWNLSKEEEADERSATAARVRKFREGRNGVGNGVGNAVTGGVTSGVTNGDVTEACNGVSNGNVPVRSGTESKPSIRSEGVQGKPDARSRRPIFTGQRVTVHEWQLDTLMKLLGAHCDEFDLHEWFFALDARCVNDGTVPPDRDSGAWLKAECIAEAQRRGIRLKVATAKDVGANGQATVDAVRAMLAREGRS